MACDLLQGLDLDALSPLEAAAGLSLHLPDGRGGASFTELFPRGDAPLAGRLRRCPQRASNRHTLFRHGVPQLSELGFATSAVGGFREYCRAQIDGEVPATLRFQVNVPTPYTLLAGSDSAVHAPELLADAERAIVAEVATLSLDLPPEHLALQWDVSGETRVWETRGRDPGMPRGLPERLLESFVTICAAVPAEMELGFHFCHGGVGGRDALAPEDGGQVSRLLGAIIASTEREPAFVHLPVPRGRDDSGYFEPLAQLAMWPQMQLYLGLLHPEDGVGGAAARLAAARAVLHNFGVAAACGSDPALSLPVFAALIEQHQVSDRD